MSEKNIEEPHLECPSSVELSAWCDGEQVGDFKKHVDKCPHCYAHIQFFISVDNAVKNASTPPDDLVGNIMIACTRRNSVKRMPLRLLLSGKFAKKGAAALVLIAGLVFGFQFYNSGSSSKSSGSSNDTGEPLANSEESGAGVGIAGRTDDSESAASDSEGQNRNREEGENMSVSRQGGQSRLIKTISNSSDPVADDKKEQGSRSNVFPGSVHHVWVVNDLEKSSEILKEVVPNSCTRILQEKGDNYMKYCLVLKDDQLQRLVEALGKRGWALVPSDQSQSAEPTQLTMVGREIMYSVDIVSSGQNIHGESSP